MERHRDLALERSQRERLALPGGIAPGAWRLSFNADGSRLAAASDSLGDVVVWKLGDGGRPLGPPLTFDAGSGNGLLSFEESVASVAFSPVDPQLLATGGFDGSAGLWDAGTGRHVGSVQGGDGGVTVSFSPDGRALLTTDEAAHASGTSSAGAARGRRPSREEPARSASPPTPGTSSWRETGRSGSSIPPRRRSRRHTGWRGGLATSPRSRTTRQGACWRPWTSTRSGSGTRGRSSPQGVRSRRATTWGCASAATGGRSWRGRAQPALDVWDIRTRRRSSIDARSPWTPRRAPTASSPS